MSKHGIIGPFWFEDDEGRSQTVNKERYMAVLNKYWASLGRRAATMTGINKGCIRKLEEAL